MQATTRAMEEEPSPKMQASEEEEEIEIPGQRNPKADTGISRNTTSKAVCTAKSGVRREGFGTGG